MEYLCIARGTSLLLYKNNRISKEIDLQDIGGFPSKYIDLIQYITPSHDGTKVAIQLQNSRIIYIYDFTRGKLVSRIADIGTVVDKHVNFCTNGVQIAVKRGLLMDVYDLEDCIPRFEVPDLTIIKSFRADYLSPNFEYSVHVGDGAITVYNSTVPLLLGDDIVFREVEGCSRFIPPVFSLCGRFFAYCTRRSTLVYNVNEKKFTLFKKFKNEVKPSWICFHDTTLWLYSAYSQKYSFTHADVLEDLEFQPINYKIPFNVRSNNVFLHSKEYGLCFIKSQKIVTFQNDDYTEEILIQKDQEAFYLHRICCFITFPIVGQFTKSVLR